MWEKIWKFLVKNRKYLAGIVVGSVTAGSVAYKIGKNSDGNTVGSDNPGRSGGSSGSSPPNTGEYYQLPIIPGHNTTEAIGEKLDDAFDRAEQSLGILEKRRLQRRDRFE